MSTLLPQPLTIDLIREDDAPTPSLEIACCIILAGGLRPSPLAAAAGQSVLDLYLTPERTVLEVWIQAVRRACGNTTLPVRIISSRNLPPPRMPSSADPGIAIESEPRPFRGPAGVLLDVCAEYPDHHQVLVVEAARFPASNLSELLQHHAAAEADITVGVQPDHSPAGVWIIRVAALRLAPLRGFVDLKEQWLPRALRAGCRARVAPLTAPGVLPLRTRRNFLRAAAHASFIAQRHPEATETSADHFRIICRGALIGPGAIVTDSIVMPGAVIGPDANIVRSVITSRSEIKTGENIADAVVRTHHDPVNPGACCA